MTLGVNWFYHVGRCKRCERVTFCMAVTDTENVLDPERKYNQRTLDIARGKYRVERVHRRDIGEVKGKLGCACHLRTPPAPPERTVLRVRVMRAMRAAWQELKSQ